MTTKPTLLDKIEGVMDLTGMSATKFGYLAVGDPAFVLKLRRGRQSRPGTVKKVMAFLDEVTAGGAR
jgi:hypothetical protein